MTMTVPLAAELVKVLAERLEGIVEVRVMVVWADEAPDERVWLEIDVGPPDLVTEDEPEGGAVDGTGGLESMMIVGNVSRLLTRVSEAVSEMRCSTSTARICRAYLCLYLLVGRARSYWLVEERR